MIKKKGRVYLKLVVIGGDVNVYPEQAMKVRVLQLPVPLQLGHNVLDEDPVSVRDKDIDRALGAKP